MQTKIKVIGVIVLAVLVLGFLKTGSTNKVANTNPIKIGASISLTGVAADFGDMSKKAMDLAVEEINNKGGINGRKVELVVEDDRTDPKGSVSAYQKLVHTDNVDAVIGGIFDFTAQPLLPLAQQDKIAFVSPINFVIKGAMEMNPYTFVLYPNFDTVVGQLQSVIIDDKNIHRLGMIRYNSAFGESIEHSLSSFIASWHDAESNPLFVAEKYNAIGSSDFRTNITKLKDKNLDAVFLDMLDFDIVKYLTESKALGFNKKIIAYTTLRDVLQKKDVDFSGLEGAIMLDWEVPSANFENAFKAKYKELPRRGADKSYDAIYMLAEAIANSSNKSEVPAYIENHSFNTANGSFKLGPDHAVADIAVKVFEVYSGKLVEIKNHTK